MKMWAKRGLLVLFGLVFATQIAPAAPISVTNAWAARVFAPYAYIPRNSFSVTNCFEETGQKYFTLAFVISDSDGQPAWDGSQELRTSTRYYLDQIQELRAHGGDILISFGGEAGVELAIKTSDAIDLEAKYQSVINQYGLTWMDFDIEGKALSKVEANQRRNSVLKQLQIKNPGLKISFTVPVNPVGLENESVVMIKDAFEKGVAVESVNIMTMDFGTNISRGQKMGELAVMAANGTRRQLDAIGARIKIGLTPMIGRNDVKAEVFTLEDARTLMDFARKTPWIRSVSFWSVNRDRPPTSGKGGNRSSGIEQEKWDFTKIFQQLP